jgi:hypothetical protein
MIEKAILYRERKYFPDTEFSGPFPYEAGDSVESLGGTSEQDSYCNPFEAGAGVEGGCRPKHVSFQVPEVEEWKHWWEESSE